MSQNFSILCLLIPILLSLTQVRKSNYQKDVPFVIIERAISKGNLDSLTLFIPTQIEINFNIERKLLKKKEAVIFLERFFKENPPQSFEYQHKGQPKEGLRYFIGRYKYEEGTYTFYLLLKEVNQKVTIETIDIN